MTVVGSVRRAMLADVPRLAPLFDAYRVFYKQPSDLPRAAAFLSDRLTAADTVLFIATSTTGAIVGFVHLFPSFSSVSTQRLWVLNDLFVDVNARREGFGRLLMNAAKDHAVSTGAKGLMLETARDNFAGQTLYESLGYKRSDDLHFFLATPEVSQNPA
ncbi:acetyltransferase [Achlya hypogyna]|uniref:Acetyltransferase n=1 Tax=Achlya hypogyna TaxID=1202772 RepID=A0A1V9YQB6_ACHHY|nr:acetyltransferase [Achlya hypogyna]